MYIQGNLQKVFDVLFDLGVIEPTLKSDWAVTEKQMAKNPRKLYDVVRAVNEVVDKPDQLANRLGGFDEESLIFLAMEVAREYVDFQTRQSLH